MCLLLEDCAAASYGTTSFRVEREQPALLLGGNDTLAEYNTWYFPANDRTAWLGDTRGLELGHVLARDSRLPSMQELFDTAQAEKKSQIQLPSQSLAINLSLLDERNWVKKACTSWRPNRKCSKRPL